LRVAEVRARLADLKPVALPTVAEAQKVQRAAWAARPASERVRAVASTRPTGQPTPGRYDVLRQAQPTAQSEVKPETHKPQVKAPLKAPQLVPKPPSWAQPASPAQQPFAPRPVRPASVTPPPVDAGHLAEVTAQAQRQANNWARMASGIRAGHQAASAALEAHHASRMGAPAPSSTVGSGTGRLPIWSPSGSGNSPPRRPGRKRSLLT
jgi:hypothetical protein